MAITVTGREVFMILVLFGIFNKSNPTGLDAVVHITYLEWHIGERT